MSMLRSILFAALIASVWLALAPAASAQQQGIEREMSPEEFKAAGLDKLSADELARLNAWLNRTVETATAKASVEAKKKVEDDNRGFFNFGSMEPIVGKITGEFRGFAKGRQYTLSNGNVWRQIDDASLAGVKITNPEVKVNPSMIGNAWYMAVKGYNTRAKVERIK